MKSKPLTEVFDDPVNNPPHYTQGTVECIEAIASALGATKYEGFLQGQVMKYVWRAPHKGKAQQDYKKAEFYLKRLIKLGDPS